MRTSISAVRAVAGILAITVVGSGCTTKSQEAPPLSGPSEFGTSIVVTATPDAITQDGASQSLITISARDSNGSPLRNLSLRSEITVGGVRTDFGALSARNLVTDAGGRATLVYTAPAALAGQASVDQQTVVTVQVTPYGTDFANAVPRLVNIRLLPIGIVLPPNGTPIPNFTFSPATASENVKIQFDASTSSDDGRIVSYNWTFGDGDSGTGVTISRAYAAAGSYNVTLTVTDDRGLSASTTKVVTIGAGANPAAAFTASPAAPIVNSTTFFDASLSVPASGRKIVSYAWTFGDGGSATGLSPTHTFTAAGAYAVTLTVTDDVGKTGVSTQTLNVTAPAGGTDPVASFTTSPAAPSVNETVFFNASASTAAAGRTITSYSWNFGDGATATGVTTTHAYAAAATYTVTLSVTDSAGRTSLTTKQVTIGAAAGPTANLTVSPSSAVINSPVQAIGSGSTTQPGQTIVQYDFNFGDGSATVSGSSSVATHTYTATGTYTITLTVRDSAGRSATTLGTVSIVANVPPTAVFVYTPNSPVPVGTSVNFDASQSRAAQNATINRYQWTFGDSGTLFTTTSPTITHAYTAPGTYSVTLTVFDNQGGTNTTTRSITIQ